MLILLSPSKTLETEAVWRAPKITRPRFLESSAELTEILRRYSEARLGKLMDISPALASLNAARFARWRLPFTKVNARPAIRAFQGDVYEGLNAGSYSDALLLQAQTHLRTLSGLYGLLRPLDLMQPYRLEMGTRLKTPSGHTLYDFWGERITKQINADAKAAKAKAIVNLASQEYFKAVHPAKLTLPLITPVFKERKGRELKIVALFAKRARGRMADFILREGAAEPKILKSFDCDGYRFEAGLSNESRFIFSRNS